jgi:hypothetical protein
MLRRTPGPSKAATAAGGREGDSLKRANAKRLSLFIDNKSMTINRANES